MSELARLLGGDNYASRSISGLKRGGRALADMLSQGANQGVGDMEAALYGSRVKPGAVMTDAGYVDGDALKQGRYDSGLEPEGTLSRALMLTGGAIPAKDMGRGVTAIFAGARAKTANMGAHALAQDMEKGGATRDAIWEATGWFKAPDGQWKWEIDDSAAKMRGSALPTAEVDGFGKVEAWRMNDALDHANLYSAYPELKDIQSSFMRGGGAEFKEFSNTPGWVSYGETYKKPLFSEAQEAAISRSDAELSKYVNSPDIVEYNKFLDSLISDEKAFDEFFTRNNGSEIEARTSALASAANEARRAARAAPGGGNTLEPGRALGTSLHEIQHAIQAQEGFARGGQVGGDEYRRLAGEVESRAVEARRNLSPEQRIARPPWLDYDVPEDQQIVRMLLGQR